MSSKFETPLYPGVNPDDNLGPQLNTVCVVFMCLSFVTVVLRFVSRILNSIRLALDDWFIIAAAVGQVGLTAPFHITDSCCDTDTFVGLHCRCYT